MTTIHLEFTWSRGAGHLFELGKRAWRATRDMLAGARRRLRRATPRDWFLLCLGLLLLAFSLTLLIQPTAVGRGGR